MILKIVNDTVQHQEHIKAQEKIKAQHKKKSQINGKSKKIKFDANKFGAPSHIQLEIISEKEDEQELESLRIHKPVFESKDILQDI